MGESGKSRRRRVREERKIQREEEREERQKRRKLTKWAKAALALAIVTIAAYFLFRPPDTAGKGLLSVATPVYAFGQVSVAEGTAAGQVALTNRGEGPLTITRLESSCGCTSASITAGGEEGPVFGMSHGKNSYPGWSTVIPPGGEAVLNVYYNPRVHPELRGPVTRVVTIYSDDPLRPVHEVRISADQVA